MKTQLLLIACAVNLLLASPLTAQGTGLWPEDVDALIESNRLHITIVGPNEAEYRVERTAVIFNRHGRSEGRLLLQENQMLAAEAIEGNILDMQGAVLRKLTKDDISEHRITIGASLYDDSKYQLAELEHHSFPYKVHWSYTIKLKSLIYWPSYSWFPQEEIPVLHSSYTLTLQTPIAYRNHAIGQIEPPDSSISGGVKSFTWHAADIEPVKKEPFMPPENISQYGLLFTAGNFLTDNVQGSNESWNDVAAWYRRLVNGRLTLPPTAREEIRRLVSPDEHPRRIVEKVYRYLQDNTRYVAISLGIGGWQPHTVASVYQNKYGDCKDLSMFALAMLQEFGITGYPALVLTRDMGLTRPEFPGIFFNHLIAFIPLGEDTLWLECTSDKLSAGQLHSGIEGCNVLVVKDNTGEIITTPESLAADNRWLSRLSGQLGASGSLQFEGRISMSGNQAGTYRDKFLASSQEEVDKKVRDLLGENLSRITVETYNLENLSENYREPLRLQFKARALSAGSASGQRLFFNPNILNRFRKRMILDEEVRTFPLHFSYAYSDRDSLEIVLPIGYRLESAPEPLIMENDYSRYESSYSLDGRTLKYLRLHELKKRRIPLEAYEEYRTFMQKLRRRDNENFVFVK